MARSKTSKWVGLGLAATLGIGAYEFGLFDCGSTSEVKHLANQVWIERLPQNDRDQIHHLVLLEQGRDRFGAFGKSSQWRHFLEIFAWHREQNRLTLHLPQDRVRVNLEARVWECEDEAPAPFELCLELKGERGHTSRYYSRYEWVIEGGKAPHIEGLPELAPHAAPTLPEGVEFTPDPEAQALLAR
ncbi:hypothetical protein [Nannocystis punicea]|uniref:Uncharacterized protein n=1 Tax=Nannocystis punicea TaxID=2995304 RepID=A0ABY7HBC5_9BACT|nr:hypothetical protein [Nannocystis poenicansa]WAS96324.1 hypothetical protein O0S08_09200 [Nannocystis poenicansa]